MSFRNTEIGHDRAFSGFMAAFDWPISLVSIAILIAVTFVGRAGLLNYISFIRCSPKQDNFDIFNPPVLRQHTAFESYSTPITTYPKIRRYYRQHQNAQKLPAPAKLPLLVFVHGLGGSFVQFVPLLRSLANVSHCFAIELPGCGLSAFSPQTYEAYKLEALTVLWKTAIESICHEHGHESAILIGHSLGCSISALLASANTSAELRLSVPIRGLIAVCPRATPPSQCQASAYRKALAFPTFLLDLWRLLDGYGGLESKSVRRFVGESADGELKSWQRKLNKHFKTSAWKIMAYGILPQYDGNGTPRGGLPGEEAWRGIQVPVLLIGGDSDVVTKPEDVVTIMSYLDASQNGPKEMEMEQTDTIAELAPDSNTQGTKVPPSTTESQSHHNSIVKKAILPAPAAHALLYDHTTYRTVAGLIEDFLAEHISPQLSVGWQLQQLTSSGKWDVKNLKKWKDVVPVSGPIPSSGGIFRALKTLREQDEEHTPSVFVKNWKEKIAVVVDISHDTPIYDTPTLEKGGVLYRKYPTTSKIPPSVGEVNGFNVLVDRLRRKVVGESTRAVGVHCHYGYNRTGFFIICYLVEREGWTLEDAIAEFKRQRAPGIRHEHFFDTLFARYGGVR